METTPEASETTAPVVAPATPETQPVTPAIPPPISGTLLDGIIVPDPVDPNAVPKPLIPPVKSKYVNDDGSLADDWRKNLRNQALHDNPTLGLFKTFDDFAESFVEKAKMIGQRQERIAIPALDAPPEKWAEYRKLNGAPETPTGYGELRPDTVPKEAWDNELEGATRAIAHKWGAPPGLIKEITEKYTERQMAVQQMLLANESQKLEQVRAQLREDFGADYDRQMAYALNGAIAAGFDHNDPEQRAFFTHPIALKNFAKMFQMNLMGDRGEGMKDGVNGFGGGIDDRIKQVKDSPEYKGVHGQAAALKAQEVLHNFMHAKEQMKNQPIRRAS